MKEVRNLKPINPLSPELNPICYLLALLAHVFLHVTRIRVKSLTLR
jgi:transposase